MANFDLDGFSGTLHELLEGCANYIPKAQVLVDAQRRLSEEIEAAKTPLLARRRASDGRRGEPTSGPPAFYPVDNEPVIAFYDLLVREEASSASVFELLLAKKIPLSWFVEPEVRDGRFRIGPAKAKLRDDGLKLAHLVDCGRMPPRESTDDVRSRAFRTLSPLNVFPFPSARRWDVKVDGVSRKDPAEDPTVRALMAAFLAHHVAEHPAAIEAWRASSGSTNSLAAISLERAREIRVSIRRKATTTAAADAANGAAPKHGRSNALAGLDVLVPLLKSWRGQFPGATRLAGSEGATSPWIHVLLSFSNEGADAAKSERSFHINGDTTATAIDRLIALYDSDLEVDEIFLHDETKGRGASPGGTPCLRLADTEGAEGFYCYED